MLHELRKIRLYVEVEISHVGPPVLLKFLKLFPTDTVSSQNLLSFFEDRGMLTLWAFNVLKVIKIQTTSIGSIQWLPWKKSDGNFSRKRGDPIIAFYILTCNSQVSVYQGETDWRMVLKWRATSSALHDFHDFKVNMVHHIIRKTSPLLGFASQMHLP